LENLSGRFLLKVLPLIFQKALIVYHARNRVLTSVNQKVINLISSVKQTAQINADLYAL